MARRVCYDNVERTLFKDRDYGFSMAGDAGARESPREDGWKNAGSFFAPGFVFEEIEALSLNVHAKTSRDTRKFWVFDF